MFSLVILFKNIPSVLVCMDQQYLTMLSRMYSCVLTHLLYCYNDPLSTDSLHCLYTLSKVKISSLYWWRKSGYVSETWEKLTYPTWEPQPSHMSTLRIKPRMQQQRANTLVMELTRQPHNPY